MNLANHSVTLLGAAAFLLSACDPHGLDIDSASVAGASGDNSSSASFEILSDDYVQGNVKDINIVSQNTIASAEFGQVKVLKKDEKFSVNWDVEVSETSDLTLYLKQPANPDGTNGGFFNFNTCDQDGGCTKSSTTCEYSTTVINSEEKLGNLECIFTHPDSGLEIINAPELDEVLEKTIADLPDTFELRAKLCGVSTCDVIRIGYVQINR